MSLLPRLAGLTSTLTTRHQPHRHRTRTGTLLAAALAAFALAATPAQALSATATKPASAPPMALTAAHTDSDATHPTLLPTPQSVTWDEEVSIPLGGAVILNVTNNDAPTTDLLTTLVANAGGHIVPAGTTGATTITVTIASASEQGDDPALVPAHPEAYRLSMSTAGEPSITIAGSDDRGAFYGAHTLRQLLTGSTITGATIRDWPLMSVRGTIEGFYGIPWSHQARMDILAWSGQHKMNTYIYTPKDDPYLRAKWREPYPASELASIKELVDTAASQHVDFVFALSPGNDVCYSSEEDFAATTAKFDQLKNIGVRSFYIALDDIAPRLNCSEDSQAFPDRGPWTQLADAQSHYLNRIQHEYVEAQNLPDLMVVPTNYSGNQTDPFKTAQGERLDPDIRMQWTGMGVFSDTITSEQVKQAAVTYNNDHLFLWDNFPVNDGQRGRLFLNPLTGRDAELYKHLDGFTANPMIQPYASLPSLANYGDYTWNGPAYDPQVSFSAALDLIADDGALRPTLDAFVDLNQAWTPYRPSSQHAPALNADISAFIQALEGPDRDSWMEAATRLRDRLELIAQAPTSLSDVRMSGFYEDIKPWALAAADWAHANEEAVAILLTMRELANGTASADETSQAGQRATAALMKMHDYERAASTTKRVSDMDSSFNVTQDAIVPQIGDGAFRTLIQEATTAWNTWMGLTAAPSATSLPIAAASTTMGQYQDNAPQRAIDGNGETFWWSNSAPEPGSSFTIDLGSVEDIGRIVIQQGRSANQTSDMFYHAQLEVSSEGEQWETLGTFDDAPTIVHDAAPGVRGRYIRLAATQASNTWVQIRDISVTAPSHGLESTLTTLEGHGIAAAVDADGATWLQASEAPEGASVTRTYDEVPHGVLSAVVAGTLSGTVEVRSGDGSWMSVGQLSPDLTYQVFPFDGPADAVRIVAMDDSPLPLILEMGLRSTRESDPARPESTPQPGDETHPQPGLENSGVAPSSPATNAGSMTPTPQPSAHARPKSVLARTGTDIGIGLAASALFLTGGILMARRRRA